IQSLKKAGTQNPVILLDEIDKMSTDFRGDPASALLEVLDPEQNKSFNDHYLDLDYDLSEVMFITTANSLSGIPIPLRDRMEIIELSSYTEIEKLAIAKRYLVPKTKRDCGLEQVDIEVGDDALREVMRHYTREAGVRSLERQVASLMRKLALRVVKEHGREVLQSVAPTTSDAAGPVTAEGAVAAPAAEPSARKLRYVIDRAEVVALLGVHKYRDVRTDEHDLVGLTHGLSVSDFGGDILDCEVTVVAGKGKLVITGLLEKGMEESAQAALSYIRARSSVLGLDAEFYQTKDLHVHFPDFVRKDGPSAGVTMATSMASALTRIPVRHDIAMTGEIT